MQDTSLPFGICIDLEWYLHENSPSALLTPFKRGFQFEKEFQTFEIKCNVYEPFLAKIFTLYGARINVVEGRVQR